MTITLPPHLVKVLVETAARRGCRPEELAIGVLEYELDAEEVVEVDGQVQTGPAVNPSVTALPPLPEPRNEWERRLFAIGIDCGVSPSDHDLSRESLYD